MLKILTAKNLKITSYFLQLHIREKLIRLYDFQAGTTIRSTLSPLLIVSGCVISPVCHSLLLS